MHVLVYIFTILGCSGSIHGGSTVKKVTQLCDQIVHESVALVIEVTRRHAKVVCAFDVLIPNNKMALIRVEPFRVGPGQSECQWITIDNNKIECGSSDEYTIVTNSHHLPFVFDYTTQEPESDSDRGWVWGGVRAFNVTVTVYHKAQTHACGERDTDGLCCMYGNYTNQESDVCDENRCISRDAFCDGSMNCVDESDEDLRCKPWWFWLLVSLGSVLGALVIAFIVYKVRQEWIRGEKMTEEELQEGVNNILDFI